MTTTSAPAPLVDHPWRALWALVIGFFMILVDTTIVVVATPALMRDLDAGITEVVWVTSAYLLAYAVPLLVTGRLGDRYGPRRIYLVGLTTFTLASLWCGLTDDIGGLVTARVVQGAGAAMMTPQTMAVITRIFPPEGRGRAMGVWGATAGIATLVGPILGGFLVGALGWEWIFFINVPVGVFAFLMAVRHVPALETHEHRFDWLGVALSGIGMFLLVFAIQEGETHDWGTVAGAVTIPRMLGLGLVVMTVFLVWQWRNRGEPLVPLPLFRDRNYSLACLAMTTIGFAITSMSFPIMIWAQAVRGWSPVQAAMLMIPMAVLSGVLAPWVGAMADRMHPRWLAGFGIASFSLSMVWLWLVMTPDSPVWLVLLPMALMGVANGFMWSPISSTATRNLPLHRAGAGAGVYNTVRQVGSVLGSAAIAALMAARLAAYLPGTGGPGGPGSDGMSGDAVPAALADGFSHAMAESMLLPAAVVLLGLVAVLSFERPRHLGPARDRGVRNR